MKLAIHGGSQIRTKPFPGNKVIGAEEHAAVQRVLNSGILSGFYGSYSDKFYGGQEVRTLEKEWATYFGVKHAIAVNSATSGLNCAVGALDISPGDEIIVSPYTMCASATCGLIYGAVPVFADIDPDYFCLSPDAVRKAITPRTKAILAVDIFGHPFAAGEIAAIAKEHGISIIEDASQAPGARYKGRYAGTLGDIGVFSLNYHKHIHCGEGGIIVTDDDQLAERMQLIRNHAEAVVGPMGRRDIANMVGFNFRMTELEAAIARCQLLKLESLLVERRARIASLNERLREIPALMMPKTAEECVHSYYVHVLKFDEAKAGVSRDSFVKAVAAELPSIELKEDEGACISAGYVKPLYNLPVFQQRISIGRDGYPWRLNGSESQVSYAPGICPVAERMHQSEVILHEYVSPFMTESDLDDLASIFLKVWSNRESI